MKNILILLLILLTAKSYGQITDSCDNYKKAKSIIRDLDSIVSPNGIQESYETAIGGIKQWIYIRGKIKVIR